MPPSRAASTRWWPAPIWVVPFARRRHAMPPEAVTSGESAHQREAHVASSAVRTCPGAPRARRPVVRHTHRHKRGIDRRRLHLRLPVPLRASAYAPSSSHSMTSKASITTLSMSSVRCMRSRYGPTWSGCIADRCCRSVAPLGRLATAARRGSHRRSSDNGRDARWSLSFLLSYEFITQEQYCGDMSTGPGEL
jgi:hypothetical protein